MSEIPKVSIIICTCSRADDLRQTLASISRTCVPADVPTELIVVDNGSTDETASVVQAAHLPNMSVRYVSEPRRGKCYAYNAGLAAARGSVVLFTDDDVRPPQHWIAGMVGPILAGETDAMAGGVKFAPHLEHPGLTLNLRTKMADTHSLKSNPSAEMVGANMAFAKAVLQRVPAFDPELGPGAMGFADETLFSRQLLQAGFQIRRAFEVTVEHHFDPSRLTRASLLSLGERHGRSNAYLFHHWQHDRYRLPLLRYWQARVTLAALRALRPGTRRLDYVPEWEMELVERIGYFHQYLIESRRPYNYEKLGLVKQNGLRDDCVRGVTATC